MALKLRFRQIHLDFHTSPDIADVGSKFDADAFADTMKAAHVDSVTVFAKCHHGHLYYDTNHEARHPTLPRKLDLLGEQIEALHRRDIKAPIYISVQCDEYAAQMYPQWRVVNPDGKLAGSPLEARWHILDMSSPYQDYLADQIDEIVRKFKPMDGVFLDMCWDQPSISTWAIEGMLGRGLDPAQEADRHRYAHEVSLQYMARYKKQIESMHGGKQVRIYYNSRGIYRNLAEEKKYISHVELEALPTGGWGYAYFPLNVRFAMPEKLPILGMTARFHKSWADFGGLKPQAALMYECCQMLSVGATCSVGDQLHPRGTLDKASYQLIGQVFKHVEACEPWCHDAQVQTEIAVIGNPKDTGHSGAGTNAGVVHALQQLRQQFVFIAPGGQLKGYKLVIVPETINVDDVLRRQLQAFVKSGGALLIAGKAALNADGQPVLSEQGIVTHGESPFTATYLRFDPAILGDFPQTDHVIYDRGYRITPGKGATALARIVEPYFDRNWQHFSSHNQTPSDKLSKFAAAVQKGRVITISFPVFNAYSGHGNLSYRHLIGSCIARLLPEPLVKFEGPSHVEVTLTRQAKRAVVHVLSFCPRRRTPHLDIVEEAWPLHGAPLSVKLDKAPKRVTLQPGGQSVAFEYKAGRVHARVDVLNGHQMVVFE